MVAVTLWKSDGKKNVLFEKTEMGSLINPKGVISMKIKISDERDKQSKLN